MDIVNKIKQIQGQGQGQPQQPAGQSPSFDASGFQRYILNKYPNLDKGNMTNLQSFVKTQQQSQLVEKGGMPYADLVKANPGAALDLVNKGYNPSKQPTTKQTENDDKLEKAKNLLKGTADYLIKEVGLTNNKTQAQFGGRARTLLSKVRNDPKLSAYNTTKDGLRVQLVKLLGDTGNVALQEQINSGKLFPQITDTSSEVTEKVRLFNKLVDATKISPSGSNKDESNNSNDDPLGLFN